MAAAPKHDVFQAIAAPTRRQLLKLLGEQDNKLSVLKHLVESDEPSSEASLPRFEIIERKE